MAEVQHIFKPKSTVNNAQTVDNAAIPIQPVESVQSMQEVVSSITNTNGIAITIELISSQLSELELIRAMFPEQNELTIHTQNSQITIREVCMYVYTVWYCACCTVELVS